MAKIGSIDYNMNLAWHIRLIDRMIKNDPNATIKNYFSIVVKEEENEIKDVSIMKAQIHKRKRYADYKKTCIA